MKMRSPNEHCFARLFFSLAFIAAWSTSVHESAAQKATPSTPGQALNQQSTTQTPAVDYEVATFGGGCFWCVEAVFENVPGVADVVSGYAGGKTAKPTYEMVKTGLTGHAEVCQITYDPAKIRYRQLVEIFMKTHDPTSKNKQGPDYGTQYRSAIFYHSDEQKSDAESVIAQLDQGKSNKRKVVTTLEPFTAFYLAEEYHQDYFRKHPADAYCMTYARPKVAKVKKVVKELERKEKQ